MDLHVDLGSVPGASKRARLETALRDGIRDGRLAPESRLPPTRLLCDQLGVSRGVVVDAYAQLAAEGYLRTRRGGGTTVAAIAAPRPTRSRAATEPTAIRYDLNPFTPALAHFPRATLAAAIGHVLRNVPDARLGLGDPSGEPALREALAGYLGRARGVRADPGQILITGGTRHGISLVWAALVRAGETAVGCERPGWEGVAETVREAGLTPVVLPVDAQGADVAQLPGLAAVGAVAVAPAHQYPTGAVLSADRRQALMAWAGGGRRVIVEDDYDAEYRYDRQPVGCLQGLAPESVVYAGSTSKTLSPALRLGWLVLPSRLVEPVAAVKRIRGGASSPLLQLALAHLIERGDLDRHLRRERRRHQRRREALLDALSQRLAAQRVFGASAGLFAVLELPPGVRGSAVVAAAARRGVALEAWPDGLRTGALVLGYANLATSAAPEAVARVAAALDACR